MHRERFAQQAWTPAAPQRETAAPRPLDQSPASTGSWRLLGRRDAAATDSGAAVQSAICTMSRSDHSSAIALGLSLLLHGTIFYACNEVVDRRPKSVDRPAAPAPPPALHTRVLVEDAAKPEQRPLLWDKPVTPPPLLPKPAALPLPSEPDNTPLAKLKPKPIIPVELAPQSMVRPAEGFGELTGTPEASAMHSLSGDVPMQALKGDQDQPYISRDPSGVVARPESPAKSDYSQVEKAGEQQAESGEKQRPAKVAAVGQKGHEKVEESRRRQPAPEADPTRYGPLADAATKPVQIAMATARPEKPEIAESKEVVRADQGKPERSDSKEAGPPGAAGSPTSLADSAPQTDSESDPFSTQGSAEFRPGKVIAHFGRKIKTVRPRLTLAGQYDLFSVEPSVVLQVRADETGNVREVKVIRSSGSREVDQPCVLAMYDWWFEPPRDAKGAPQASEMLWTLSFRVR